jgi:hypothetical protein
MSGRLGGARDSPKNASPSAGRSILARSAQGPASLASQAGERVFVSVRCAARGCRLVEASRRNA